MMFVLTDFSMSFFGGFMFSRNRSEDSFLIDFTVEPSVFI